MTAFIFPLAALFFLVACPATDSGDRETVLDIPIDKNNDSLLTFDTLIIKVYSKDSSFVQEVFHGKLTDPNKLMGLPLDPKVGREFTVSIIGYKAGKMGMNREIKILDLKPSNVKDLPIKDTVHIDPTLPEILAPSDTSESEGDTLRFRVGIRNPWSGPVNLSMKNAPTGAKLDTTGTASQYAYFTFPPTYAQGRSEAYSMTLVYASSDRQIEKTLRVTVRNVNRPPRITPIADQKVKENETLGFKPEATDPDGDSITLVAVDLPTGAQFAAGAFTWKPAPGQTGNYSVKFKAFDGQDSDFVAVLISVGDVDLPPPLTLEIISPAGDTTVNTTPITIHYKVNGTTLQKPVALKEGKNRIYLDTTVAGRTAFDTITVTLDIAGPGTPKVKGLTPVNTRTPTWTWSSGGGGNGNYRYRVDSEDMTGATLLKDTLYLSPKDLDPGNHTLFVQERDDAGNWSPTGKHTIRIDTTRPSAPTVTVNPGSPTNDTRPTWTWVALGEDIAGVFRYRLNNPDLRTGATGTNQSTFRPDDKNVLTEGPHILYVQQRDSAGNWSLSGSAALVVDLTPPEPPKVSAAQTSPTNVQKPEWSWTGGTGGMRVYRHKLDDSVLTSGAIQGSKNTFSPESSLKESRHVLYVQERDSAGNWSATASHALVIDLTAPNAPVFASSPLSPLNSLQPTWTWSGGGGGAGIYRARVDSDDFSRNADTLKQATFKPSSPLTEGQRTLHVQERDSAGNWSPTSTRTLHLALRGPVGTPGFSAGEADYLSMALSAEGVPYVAFADANNGNKATVMRYSGTGWETVGAAGFSQGGVEYVSLAISKTGVPHVAFVDLANGNRATVYRFSGTWELVGDPGFSVGYAAYTCLGFTSAGLPFITYQSVGQDGQASASRFNGTEWTGYGTGAISAGDASFLSMATTSTGIPYVGFRDGVKGGKATVMRLNGTTWDSVGNTGFSAGRATAISMSISSSGVPHIAFVDEANGFKATVMRLSGSTWVNVGTAGFTPGRASLPALSFGAGEIPYIAFQDRAVESKLTVMAFIGTQWTNVGIPGISTGAVSSISLAINASGIPYIAFRDVPSGNRATVLKASFDP